jgi:hypothetical protein
MPVVMDIVVRAVKLFLGRKWTVATLFHVTIMPVDIGERTVTYSVVNAIGLERVTRQVTLYTCNKNMAIAFWRS